MKCPVCKKEFDKYSNATGLSIHIRKTAYNELFNREFVSEMLTPHMDYIKKKYKVIITDGAFIFIDKKLGVGHMIDPKNYLKNYV
jgi:hypothetical protein